jgi:hypothetical protein
MQTEIHTAEPFVPQPNASGVEAANGKVTSCQVFTRFQQK